MISEDAELAGLNVTIPFKVEIMDYLDDIDPVANEIQAVNCIKISRSGNTIFLKGYNTDAPAFRDTLKPHLKKDHRRALVLGSGGAARAVCYALNDLNIAYTMVSRNLSQGILTYPDITEKMTVEHLLIINATPAGMFPNENQCPPLPYKYLTSKHLLYDLVYNPEMTIFLKKGREAGSETLNGLEMLYQQAEMSWKIWNA